MSTARATSPLPLALLLALVALAGLGGAGGCARHESDATAAQGVLPPFASPRLQDVALWDDGRAEFSTYRGTAMRYGIARPVEARVIVVKEDFDTAAGVKSDTGPVPGRTEMVLKVNTILEIPTGTYTYHQMSTAFLDRNTLAPWKLAMSSAEGCGITYVEVRAERPAGTAGAMGVATWRHVSHSYWQGEGDRDLRIPLRADRPTVAWDGLALWLRALDLTKRQELAVDLLPTQVSNRVQAVALVQATVAVAGRADGHGWRVDVRYPGRDGKEQADTFWFAREMPHVMTRLERGDGLALELAKTQRLAYWEKTKPGDEALVQP